MKKIIMYYGTECPHWHSMIPTAKKLTKSLGFKFEAKETWHNSKNAKELEKYRDKIINACGVIGVPAFFNPNTGEAICGEMPEENFKAWLKNQKR